jgi:ribosomal protein S18 acetylase RimI-like enzyme
VLGSIVNMAELSHQAIGSAIETIEWRLARQEDGPVWVALTREGRAPLLPREALTEPARRLVQDRREREEELRYFLSELARWSGKCFLLWHAGSVLGRVCFIADGSQAYMWGLALLPTLKPDMIASVVQSVITRAANARAASVIAVFEASHLLSFESKGFRMLRRYATIVSATHESQLHEESKESDKDPEPQEKVSQNSEHATLRYRVRQMTDADLAALSAIKHPAFSQNGNHPTAQMAWSEEFAQLMGSRVHKPIPDCAYVAEGEPEGEETSRFLGAIQVSQWRRVAVITDLFVARSQRGHGIGKALVDRARSELARQNYATVMATIHENSRAQQFFRKVGFRHVQQCSVVARLKFPLKDSPG